MASVVYDPPPPTPSRPNYGAADSDPHLPATEGTRVEAVVTPPEPGLIDSDRFTTLRLFARGGQGQVFVARDEQLGREVAVKELQPQYTQRPLARNRFLREAEITGSLEHPGVVPVYALGRNAEGNPYYAMRLIQGRTFHQAIKEFHDPNNGLSPAERNLKFRQLLQRFVSVCHTVAFAHSRGIVHRDIKPANVLIGSYGEAVVVDWGLARPFHATAGCAFETEASARQMPGASTCQVTADSTQMGSVLGTPAFMSPEQADGRWDRVGPATDIYALGASLYMLLTGRLTMETQPWPIMLRKIRTGDFPRIRKLAPKVARPLEAIAQKAMAIRASDRYATVHDLAQDIERWLADEPVEAYPEPWTDKTRRWIRHHRTLVSGVAVLCVTTIFALTFGLVAVNAEQRKTSQALDLAVSARFETYGVYERTSALADDLLSRQQLTPEHRAFLKQNIADLQRFAAVEVDDPKGRAAIIRAYRRMAECNLRLGDTAPAEEALASGMKRIEALPADEAQNIEARRERARYLTLIGRAHRGQNKIAEATEAFAEAKQIREQITSPSDAEAQSDLAASISNYATVLADQATATKDKKARSQLAHSAAQSFRQALALRQELAERFPKERQYLSELATAHNNLGISLQGLGLAPEAAEEFLAAKAVAEPLVAVPKPLPTDRELLGLACHRLGYLRRSKGKFDQAREMWQAAADQYSALHQEFPGVAEYVRELAAIKNCLAGLDELNRDGAGMLEKTDEVLALMTELQANGDKSARVETNLQAARVSRAQALDLLRRHAEAAAAWDDVIGAAPAKADLWRTYRAVQLVKAGRVDEGLAEVRELTSGAPAESEIYYNCSCAAAQAISADPAKATVHAELALSLLRRAHKAGYFSSNRFIDSFDSDRDLDPLRDLSEFRAFRQSLKTPDTPRP